MRSPHSRRQNPIPIYAGCFSNSIPLVEYGYYKYQSSGYCSGICDSTEELVLGLSNGTQCWCGDLLPPAQEQVADSSCDTPCQGYDLENCGGGTSFFTVWLTGLRLDVPNYQLNGISSSSTSSSTISSTSTISSARSSTGRPSIATPAHSTSSRDSHVSSTYASSTRTGAAAQQSTGDQGAVSQRKSSDHHDMLLGIVLGVVLGVLAIIFLLLLLWWYRRRRKQQSTSAVESSPSSKVKDEKEGSIAAPGNVENERPVSTLGPLVFPPIFLGDPNMRTATQSSTTPSIDQPFYTPSEEPPFAYHASAEPQAAPIHDASGETGGISSPLAHEPNDQTMPIAAAEYHPMSPYANPLESNNDASNVDPFTSEAGEEIEDTGVGIMSVNNDHTTSQGLPISSDSETKGSEFAGDSVAMSNAATGDPAGNSSARIGSVLVATRDFVARNHDEISMVRGDRIVLVEKDDKYNDGWFLGQHTGNGKIGIFPESFTILN